MIKRITSLEDLVAEKARLKAVRDERVDRLEAHWNKVRDREYRHALIRNTISDLIKNQGTWQLAASVVKGSSGWLTLLGPMLSGGKGILGKRWLWAGLGLVIPYLMKRVGNMEPGKIMEEVGVTVDRVRAYMHERRSARNAEEQDA